MTGHVHAAIHIDPYKCTLSEKLEKWALRVTAEGSFPLSAGSSDPSLRPWRVITELLLHWREGDGLTEHSDSWLREVSRCCWETGWSQLSKNWPPLAFPKQPHDERRLSSSSFLKPISMMLTPKTLFSHFFECKAVFLMVRLIWILLVGHYLFSLLTACLDSSCKRHDIHKAFHFCNVTFFWLQHYKNDMISKLLQLMLLHYFNSSK